MSATKAAEGWKAALVKDLDNRPPQNGRSALDLMAQAVVTKAMQGDEWAVNLVRDTLR